MRIVWKNHPLPMHTDAPLAHQAAMAAHQQGKFWEYHDLLFANPKSLKRDALLAHARTLGLDMKRFEQALEDPEIKARIGGEVAEAIGYGAQGTPAFFINGKFLSGAQPFENFARMINAELTRLNLPIPPGAQ